MIEDLRAIDIVQPRCLETNALREQCERAYAHEGPHRSRCGAYEWQGRSVTLRPSPACNEPHVTRGDIMCSLYSGHTGTHEFNGLRWGVNAPNHTPSSFERLGTEIGALVASKQAAYGDSFGKSGAVLQLLYPDGIKPTQFDDALAVVRIVDKLFRIATDRDALGESPFRDIAGYGILGALRIETQRKPSP